MLFTCETIEAIARFAEAKEWDRIEGLQPSAFTLSAAVELACRESAWSRASQFEISAIVKRWSQTHSILGRAIAALGAGTGSFAADSEVMFLPLTTRESVADAAFENFLRLFRRGLKQSGFSGPLSYGLAGAMEGMVDNLGQHCFDKAHSAGGLVAYRLKPRGMTFVVADLGRGALSSLSDNPDWAGLKSELEALHAIVHKGASRRYGLGTGEGYKFLFKALSSLDGDLRMRSGSAIFGIRGNLNGSNGLGGFCPVAEGFQISVLCRTT